MAIVRDYQPAPYPIPSDNQSMDRQDDKNAEVCDATIVPSTVRTMPPGERSVDQPVVDTLQPTAQEPIGWTDDVPRPLVPTAYRAQERPVMRAMVSATLPPQTREASGAPSPSVSDVQTFAVAEAMATVVVVPTTFVDAPLPVPVEPTFEPSTAVAPQPTEAIAPRPIEPVRVDPDPHWRPQDVGASSQTITTALVPSAFDYLKTGLKWAVYAFASYIALIFALIVVYRFVNPPMSSLMLQQTLAGQELAQSWVPIESISPQIVRAVLLSEDGRFCQHSGVDFDAMQDAIERARDGVPRGASTISMQVTKNLFLWPSKSYVRKAIEIPLTWIIELVWPKRRIMEVYLNIAEWGPGIFGVETASRFHFQKAASRLNEREAAQLAVALPNPYSRDAGDPGPKTRRLASDIQARMRGAYPSQTACVLGRDAD